MLFPLLVKTDTAILEVNIKNHSRDITQFQRSFTVPPYKQTLLRNTYTEES